MAAARKPARIFDIRLNTPPGITGRAYTTTTNPGRTSAEAAHGVTYARMSQIRTTGLILAGGRSRRMGGRDKAFAPLAGRPLIAHVIERLAPQVDGLAISSNASAECFREFGLPVIADALTGFQGPLAGAHAGLVAYPGDYVVTVAVDLPFLPHTLVARLKENLAPPDCAYAQSGVTHMPAILWPPGLAQELKRFLERGNRSLREWLAGHGRPVVFLPGADDDVGCNINTPEDLARVETLFATRARGDIRSSSG